MTITEILNFLEQYPADYHFPVGVACWCSYRGDYSELAMVVDPNDNVSVEVFKASLRTCLGQDFDGYKGGTYTMGELTEVYVVESVSSCGEEIGPFLLRAWLGDPPPPPLPEGCMVNDSGERVWAPGGNAPALLVQEGGLIIRTGLHEEWTIPDETVAWLQGGDELLARFREHKDLQA